MHKNAGFPQPGKVMGKKCYFPGLKVNVRMTKRVRIHEGVAVKLYISRYSGWSAQICNVLSCITITMNICHGPRFKVDKHHTWQTEPYWCKFNSCVLLSTAKVKNALCMDSRNMHMSSSEVHFGCKHNTEQVSICIIHTKRHCFVHNLFNC